MVKLIREAENKKVKAGCIPYVLVKDEPLMLFMVSSDETFGGPDPMIAKGHVDPGETVEHAALREAREELGLKTSNIIQGTLFPAWRGRIEGNEDTYEFHVYACRVDDTNDFDEPHFETERVEWLTADQFKRLGRASHSQIVQQIANKIKEQKQ